MHARVHGKLKSPGSYALAIACFLAVFVPASTARADDDASQLTTQLTSGTRFGFSLGAHSWPALSDLDSSIGGTFDSWGMDIEISWHVRTQGSGRLFWGADMGLFLTGSDIPGERASLTARGLYLVPSIKYPMGATGNFHLDAGLGLYIVDFAELDCANVNPCMETGETWEATRLGGYIGASMDLYRSPSGRFAGHAGFKIHYSNFGSPDGLGAGAGKLDGPFVMVLFGVSL